LPGDIADEFGDVADLPRPPARVEIGEPRLLGQAKYRTGRNDEPLRSSSRLW
jgi:hypothetical protein